MTTIDGQTPWASTPVGSKLGDSTRPSNWLGDVNGLPPADEDRIAFARRYFTEASEDAFEVSGRDWLHKDSGMAYVIARFDPLLSSDPRDVGVSLFVVRDDTLMFLRPEGSTTTTKSVAVGSVAGGLASGRERM